MDLVDFFEIIPKKGKSYPHIHREKFCKLTCMVLSWSMGLGGAAGVTVQPAMSFRQVQVTAATVRVPCEAAR